MTLAMVGLGRMGGNMMTRLRQHGHEVIGYDRDPKVSDVPDLWTPVAELPHEAFVDRLHKAIASFAESTGVEKPFVEVELADSSRFVLDRIEPEPGFGMVTLYVTDARDDAPDALIVPIGSLRRVELRTAPERAETIGFSVPAPK